MTSGLVGLLVGLEGRRRLARLVALSAAAAMLDALTVALIFPVFVLVARPGTLTIPEPLHGLLGETAGEGTLHVLGATLVALVLVKNLAMIAVYRVQTRVARDGARRVARRLAKGYLAAPLAFHLTRQTPQFVRGIRDLPEKVYFGGGLALCNLAAETAGVVVLLGVLALLEPAGVLSALVFLGAMLWANQRVMGRRFHAWGRQSAIATRQIYGLVGQIFPNIRVVRVNGAEPALTRRLAGLGADAAAAEARRRFGQLAIRPGSEIVMMIAAVIVLAATLRGRAPLEALPFVAAFTYGIFRLLPSLNRISQCANDLRSVGIAIADLRAELAAIAPFEGAAPPRLPGFRETLALERVGYAYRGAGRATLEDVSLTIRFGEIVGIAGPSGAGKSTLVDILLGLLEPTAGRVLLDGAPGAGDGGNAVGYVPQTSLLLNASVRENVAFGIEPAAIDEARVAEAVVAASLDETIALMPRGLDTEVGEFGAALSGGQRQRIAIARALYARPSILILDEATSNLDAETEREVHAAIEALRGRTTVILVAHRTYLLERCDRIVVLDHGRVVDQGGFAALTARNRRFRALTRTPGATGPVHALQG